jgi:hypothetical protein
VSIVYNSAVKDARMNVVLDAIDVGTAGSIELLDSGDVLLASAPLNLPSFIEASQALTMITSPTVQCASAAASGIATKAQIKSSAGTVIISGLTVGVGAGDVRINDTSIRLGELIRFSSVTFTHG